MPQARENFAQLRNDPFNPRHVLKIPISWWRVSKVLSKLYRVIPLVFSGRAQCLPSHNYLKTKLVRITSFRKNSKVTGSKFQEPALCLLPPPPTGTFCHQEIPLWVEEGFREHLFLQARVPLTTGHQSMLATGISYFPVSSPSSAPAPFPSSRSLLPFHSLIQCSSAAYFSA